MLFDYEIWLCVRAIGARYDLVRLGLVWFCSMSFTRYAVFFIGIGLKTGLKCLMAMFCNIVTQFNDFRWTLRTFVSFLSTHFLFHFFVLNLHAKFLENTMARTVRTWWNLHSNIYQHFEKKKKEKLKYILLEMRCTLQ